MRGVMKDPAAIPACGRLLAELPSDARRRLRKEARRVEPSSLTVTVESSVS
jgi:hypothetical protein